MPELSSYKNNKISNVNNDSNNELKLEIENKHILKDIIDERTKMPNPLVSGNGGTSEEQVVYPYWIQHKYQSTDQLDNLWINITDTIKQNETKTIYIYKNNSYTPNGNDTFLVFDDFEGTELDTNKWNIHSSGGLNINIQNSIITFSRDDGNYYWNGIYPKNFDVSSDITNSYLYYQKIKIHSGTSFPCFILDDLSTEGTGSLSSGADMISLYSNQIQFRNADGTIIQQWDTSTLGDNNQHYLQVLSKPNEIIANTDYYTGSDILSTTEINIRKDPLFGIYRDSITDVDYIFIYKYFDDFDIQITYDTNYYKIDITNNSSEDRSNFTIKLQLSDLSNFNITNQNTGLKITNTEQVKALHIYNTSQSYTNQQIKIDLTTLSNLGVNLQSRTDSLHIFDILHSDTQLYYWIEHDENNNPLQLWVKIPFIKQGNDGVTIYINKKQGYDNYNDGNQVFLVFDDFDGTSLDTNKWNVYYDSTYGNGINISNSQISFSHIGSIVSKLTAKQDNLIIEQYNYNVSNIAYRSLIQGIYNVNNTMLSYNNCFGITGAINQVETIYTGNEHLTTIYYNGNSRHGRYTGDIIDGIYGIEYNNQCQYYQNNNILHSQISDDNSLNKRDINLLIGAAYYDCISGDSDTSSIKTDWIRARNLYDVNIEITTIDKSQMIIKTNIIKIQNNSSNNITNTQIPIELNIISNYGITLSTQIDSLYIYDINDSNKQPLYYWIEHDDQNNPTKLWVKIPSILQNDEIDLVINKKTGYDTYLDGNQVFDFFDDFDGTELDTNWINTGDIGTNSINDSILILNGNSDGGSAYKLVNNQNVGNGKQKTVISRIIYNNTNYDVGIGLSKSISLSNQWRSGWYGINMWGSSGNYGQVNIDGNTNTITVDNVNGIYIFEVIISASNVTCNVYNSNYQKLYTINKSGTINLNTLYPILEVYKQGKFDYIFIYEDRTNDITITNDTIISENNISDLSNNDENMFNIVQIDNQYIEQIRYIKNYPDYDNWFIGTIDENLSLSNTLSVNQVLRYTLVNPDNLTISSNQYKQGLQLYNETQHKFQSDDKIVYFDLSDTFQQYNHTFTLNNNNFKGDKIYLYVIGLNSSKSSLILDTTNNTLKYYLQIKQLSVLDDSNTQIFLTDDNGEWIHLYSNSNLLPNYTLDSFITLTTTNNFIQDDMPLYKIFDLSNLSLQILNVDYYSHILKFSFISKDEIKISNKVKQTNGIQNLKIILKVRKNKGYDSNDLQIRLPNTDYNYQSYFEDNEYYYYKIDYNNIKQFLQQGEMFTYILKSSSHSDHLDQIIDNKNVFIIYEFEQF